MCLEALDDSNRSPSICGHSTCKSCRSRLETEGFETCPCCRVNIDHPDKPPILCIGVVQHFGSNGVATIEIMAPSMTDVKACRTAATAEMSTGLHFSFQLVREWNGYRYASRVDDPALLAESDIEGMQALCSEEYLHTNHEVIRPDLSTFEYVGIMTNCSTAEKGFAFLQSIVGPKNLANVFLHVSNCYCGSIPEPDNSVVFNVKRCSDGRYQATDCLELDDDVDFEELCDTVRIRTEEEEQRRQREQELEQRRQREEHQWEAREAREEQRRQRLSVECNESTLSPDFVFEHMTELRAEDVTNVDITNSSIEALLADLLAFIPPQIAFDDALARQMLLQSIPSILANFTKTRLKSILREAGVVTATIRRTRENAAEKLLEAALRTYGYPTSIHTIG